MLTLLISTLPTVKPTTGPIEPPSWEWYESPPLPELGCNTSSFTNLTPASSEYDVIITLKGVQICANITPPQGCNITIQYQWFNYTQFYEDWLDWADAQPWGYWWNWWEWVDNIDWDNETSPENSTYWHNFTPLYENINQTTQVCVWNDNVSCLIENDYTREFFDWRINYSINCSGSFTNGTCNYYFEPEYCSDIQYIYPPSPNGTACPCCSEMCIGISNADGHLMNLTFYRNDSQFEDFYIINQLFNIPNGTYCFCIDGHINNSLYYPNNYNETYHWYVNITDTVTNESLESDIFTFRTPPNPSYCPCGIDDFNTTADLLDIDTDTIRDDGWIIGFIFIIGAGLFYVIENRRRR